MARVPQPKRGEIWLVRFDPSIGAEIRKLRPAVVVNLDGDRDVCPFGSWCRSRIGKPPSHSLSWFVFLRASAANGLSKDSGADVFQVKSVSELRFVRKLGVVTEDELDEIASGDRFVRRRP